MSYRPSGGIWNAKGSGSAYAATSGVTAIAGNLIAEFAGDVFLDMAYSERKRTEQERIVKDVYYDMGGAQLVFARMVFKPAMLNTIWGATEDTSDTLADGSTAATSYTISKDTAPQALEVLFQMTESEHQKTVEIFAGKAYCPQLSVRIPKVEFAIENCVWRLCLDSDGDVVKVSKEN